MVELTSVHAAVLAVLVLLLLGLAAVNMMVNSPGSGTGYLSGGVVKEQASDGNVPQCQAADNASTPARELPIP